jgi:hypothetical protein
LFARPWAPSTAGQSARRDDRRSEAQTAAHPRLCALDRPNELREWQKLIHPRIRAQMNWA